MPCSWEKRKAWAPFLSDDLMRTAFSLICFSLVTFGLAAPTTAATALRKVYPVSLSLESNAYRVSEALWLLSKGREELASITLLMNYELSKQLSKVLHVHMLKPLLGNADSFPGSRKGRVSILPGSRSVSNGTLLEADSCNQSF